MAEPAARAAGSLHPGFADVFQVLSAVHPGDVLCLCLAPKSSFLFYVFASVSLRLCGLASKLLVIEPYATQGDGLQSASPAL